MIDFICIGAQKAGTTWLMENLKQHPSVWTPPFAKELHYFDAVHFEMKKNWILKSYTKINPNLFTKNSPDYDYYNAILDKNFAFTDSWYKHIFSKAPDDSTRGECTPLYSALSDDGISHLCKLAPKVKIIYIIRDPLDRMKSSIRMDFQRGNVSTEEDLKKLLKNELFIKRGDYAKNIPRWEKHFNSEQILYFPFGDIRNTPSTVMQQVENHIDVSSYSSYSSLTKPVHTTNKKIINFSAELTDQMQSICEPQIRFLIQHFGENFTFRTK